METQYLIRKIETCPVCKGERFFYNPEWKEMNQQYNAFAESMTHDEAADKWDQLIKDRWPFGEPPEEFPCGECEGEGKIERWIPLQQAIEELGIQFAPPVDQAERAEANKVGLPF